RPLSGRSNPLARLSDRPEPRDADRPRCRGRKFHSRHALRGGRPANPLHGLGGHLDAINYDSELRRAGADSTHGWRKLAFLARRYVLGTAGLVIMVMFVLTALFA